MAQEKRLCKSQVRRFVASPRAYARAWSRFSQRGACAIAARALSLLRHANGIRYSLRGPPKYFELQRARRDCGPQQIGATTRRGIAASSFTKLIFSHLRTTVGGFRIIGRRAGLPVCSRPSGESYRPEWRESESPIKSRLGVAAAEWGGWSGVEGCPCCRGADWNRTLRAGRRLFAGLGARASAHDAGSGIRPGASEVEFRRTA